MGVEMYIPAKGSGLGPAMAGTWAKRVVVAPHAATAESHVWMEREGGCLEEARAYSKL